MTGTPRDIRRSTGFTLLEILVALVVISVGLLGVAGLQIESLRSSRSAMLRTKAVILAADMASRIRANPPAAQAGNYVHGTADMGANNNCSDDQIGGPTVSCTPAQMAAHDIWMWKNAIQSTATGLPGPGLASVTSDGAAQPTFTVTIAWNESGDVHQYGLAVQ